MLTKYILLPDPYALVGLVSVASVRATLLEAREGLLIKLRAKYQSVQLEFRTISGIDDGNIDPCTDVLLRAALSKGIDLFVGDHSKRVVYKISSDALREPPTGFILGASIMTGTFCVASNLMLTGSLEAQLSGMPIWTRSDDVVQFKLKAAPSEAEIKRIGMEVLAEHELNSSLPILAELWPKICDRVENECQGRPSENRVQTIIGPSLPKAWRRTGPKRGRRSRAGRR